MGIKTLIWLALANLAFACTNDWNKRLPYKNGTDTTTLADSEEFSLQFSKSDENSDDQVNYKYFEFTGETKNVLKASTTTMSPQTAVFQYENADGQKPDDKLFYLKCVRNCGPSGTYYLKRNNDFSYTTVDEKEKAKATKFVSHGQNDLMDAEYSVKNSIDQANGKNFMQLWTNRRRELCLKKPLPLTGKCTTKDQLMDTKNEGKTYYLRFLKKTDEKYNAGFKNGIPSTAHYMGFTPSSSTSRAYFKAGVASKFTIETVTSTINKVTTKKGIRVYGTDPLLNGKRIFSWNQAFTYSTGYYMYQSNSNWDTVDEYTLLYYEGEQNFFLSAAQKDNKNQKLGFYDYDGYTAIYGTDQNDVLSTKFCFEEAETGSKPKTHQCNAESISDDVTGKNAVFTGKNASACKDKKMIDENEKCTAKCKDGYKPSGVTWEYTCKNEKFTDPEPAISCEQKTPEEKEMEEAIYKTLVAVIQTKNTTVDVKDDQVVEDLKAAANWIWIWSTKNGWTLANAEDKSIVETTYLDYLTTELVAPQLKALGLSDDQTKKVTEWINTEAQIKKYFRFLRSDVTEANVKTACKDYLVSAVEKFLNYSTLTEAQQKKVRDWINSLTFSEIKSFTVESAKEAFRKQEIQNFLKESNTADGKKYRNEETKEQTNIQKFVEEELAGKDIITQEEVDAALTKYYKENGVVQFGVFGALVCLLLLH